MYILDSIELHFVYIASGYKLKNSNEQILRINCNPSNLTSLRSSYIIISPTTVAQPLLTIHPFFFTYFHIYIASVSFPAFNSFHSIIQAHSPNY